MVLSSLWTIIGTDVIIIATGLQWYCCLFLASPLFPVGKLGLVSLILFYRLNFYFIYIYIYLEKTGVNWWNTSCPIMQENHYLKTGWCCLHVWLLLPSAGNESNWFTILLAKQPMQCCVPLLLIEMFLYFILFYFIFPTYFKSLNFFHSGAPSVVVFNREVLLGLQLLLIQIMKIGGLKLLLKVWGILGY